MPTDADRPLRALGLLGLPTPRRRRWGPRTHAGFLFLFAGRFVPRAVVEGGKEGRGEGGGPAALLFRSRSLRSPRATLPARLLPSS